MIAACDITDALDNWARWCRSIGECFPDAWTLGCTHLDQMAIQPKNVYKTAEERLRELLAQDPEPNLWRAMTVERIVRSLDRHIRAALKTQYIELPDSARSRAETGEQFEQRRARIATRRGGWYFTPKTYREAVDRAMDAIEREL